MSAHPLSVLIIDDCEEDREILVRYLRQMPQRDFHIMQTDSGIEGWEICQKEEPDCILIDYQMPDLDGLEFIISLSTDAKRKFCPVLMFTGQGNEAIASEAMKGGAADYLVKGKFTPEGLFRAVTRAVEKASLLRVTHEQQLEIQRSQRELEQFAYTASHDLQAPVRRVMKFLELLQLDLKDTLTERSQDYLNRAMKSANHMSQLIQALLEFAKIGGSQQPFEPVDLNLVMKEVHTQLEVLITTTGAKVAYGTLPTISGNRMRLFELFQNLLSNALKFRSNKPLCIDVSAQLKGSSWVIKVKDNGVGIPYESFESIFGLFQRVDNGTKVEGTGIGLALCKKIVDLHGGRIWVESEEGVGTAFQMTFPSNPKQVEEAMCQALDAAREVGTVA